MGMRAIPPVILLTFTLLAPAGLPAGPGGASVKADDPYAHLSVGGRLLEEGKTREASEHFRQALVYRPGSPEIAARLLALLGEDTDARILWSHAWYAAAADEKGRAAPPRKVKALLSPKDPFPARLAGARAAAVKELAAFAKDRWEEGNTTPGSFLTAWWARRLALELAAPAPALAQGPARDLDGDFLVPFPVYRPVVQALGRVMKQAAAEGRWKEALHAARSLRGMAQQGGFKDLKGRKPYNLGGPGKAAASTLGRARRMLRGKWGEPWTVEALEAFTFEEGEAFTRDHGTFANPGFAVSPNGLYRVETDCGYETLLGVARTVEDHHRRLVNWYGRDPFEGRPGVIRVVHDRAGLEAEGAPFWWAGGFQGGDTTVVRMTCGTIEGLGHTITHELTHRFDGAIYPGMPAWMVEGRAVWTGAAYGSSTDRTFVPNHCVPSTLVNVWRKGYGQEKKFREMVEGKNEEYRENYSFGYALWVYLSSWEEEDGRKPFQGRLEAYMKGCARHGQNPGEWFEQNFADGKEGRPEGLKAFAEAFGAFLSGFYWKMRKPWADRYTQKTPPGGGGGYVYDEPTWTWERGRQEPLFGQGQALIAGRVLLRAGEVKAAVQALAWAMAADGPGPEAERLLVEALYRMNDRKGAWAAEHALHFPLEPCGKKAPFLPLLRRTAKLLTLMEEAEAAYRKEGHAVAAAVMRADRNRLARWLGCPEIPPERADGDTASAFHPFDPLPRHLGRAGWTEDELLGYDEFRVPGLWFVTENEDLHVGRKKPRRATGTFDREARFHHAFALSKPWILPGAYAVRVNIRFTTAYVEGAVVIGYARHDRNLLFRFSAGDLQYVLKKKEEKPRFDHISWSLAGRYVRDGALPGSIPRGDFPFHRALPSFDLELRVIGPVVEAFVNGEALGAYYVPDGTPVEGRVGFAVSTGAYIAQVPVVERLDRSLLAERSALPPPGLDLRTGRARPFGVLRNLPVLGLPRSTNGTLLLWVPMPWLEEGEAVDPEKVLSQAREGVMKLKVLAEKEGLPQPVAVAVPAALGDERIAAFRAEAAALVQVPLAVYTHPYSASIGTPDPRTPDQCRRWVLFVDSAGAAREVLPYVNLAFEPRFRGDLLHWLTVFRDHGHPPRALPDYGHHRAAPAGAGEGSERSFGM